MRGNVLNHQMRIKERRLLRLYSLWHETHEEGVQQKCLKLLGEIMSADPAFSLRSEFQMAF